MLTSWMLVPIERLAAVPSSMSRLSFGRDDLDRFHLDHYKTVLARADPLPAVYVDVPDPGVIDFKGPDGILALARELGRTTLLVGVRSASPEAHLWFNDLDGVVAVDASVLAARSRRSPHVIYFRRPVEEADALAVGRGLTQLIAQRLAEVDPAAPVSSPIVDLLADGVIVEALTPTDDLSARHVIDYVGQVHGSVGVASYNGLRWPLRRP